jgi:eukaryotic-like serine/threonine-protein kinase
MIGSVIGNYRVTRKIGEGGMGEVFQGLDLMLEREVAIKALRPELARQASVIERFRGEAVTLARLHHPRVAMLYSFLQQDGRSFMVMEYAPGLTLAEIIQRQGAMPWQSALALIAQALEGLSHAHELGIVHRDLKPANLMISPAATVKLMDFGIARVLGNSRLTREGRLIGTLEYMSPEQIRGEETDARSDIYSLGILLYEMLSGRMPFRADSDYDLIRAQVELPPPSPREFAPEVSAELEAIVLRALAKQPDERFQTTGEFHAALRTCFAGMDGAEARQAAAEWIRFDPLETDSEPAIEPAKVGSPATRLARLAARAGEWSRRAIAPLAPAAARVQLMLGGRLNGLDWRHYVVAASILMLAAGLTLGLIGLRRQRGAPAAPAQSDAAMQPATPAPPVAASSPEMQFTAPATPAVVSQPESPGRLNPGEIQNLPGLNRTPRKVANRPARGPGHEKVNEALEKLN